MRHIEITVSLLVLNLTACGQINKEWSCANGDNCDEVDKTSETKEGPAGPKGNDGTPGKSGASCSLVQVENGTLITCGKDQVVVLNGIDGQDAVPSPYAIKGVIDPCNDNPNKFDEILLQTEGGDLIAYFEDGGKRFLSIISPGNYVTTDSSACHFTVNQDLTVSW